MSLIKDGVNNKGESSLPGTLALTALVLLVVGTAHYCISHDLNITVRNAVIVILSIAGFLALFFLVVIAFRVLTKDQVCEDIPSLERLKTLDEYSDYVYLDEPKKFSELFADRDFPLIKLHDICLPLSGSQDNITGTYKWKNGKWSAAEDSDPEYGPDVIVYGYKQSVKRGELRLDILITKENDTI